MALKPRPTHKERGPWIILKKLGTLLPVWLCLLSQVSKTGQTHLLCAPGLSGTQSGGRWGREDGSHCGSARGPGPPGPSRPKAKPRRRQMRFHSQAASLQAMGLSHLLSLQTSDVNVFVLKKKKKAEVQAEEMSGREWEWGRSPGLPRPQAGPQLPFLPPRRARAPPVCVLVGGNLSRTLGPSRSGCLKEQFQSTGGAGARM